MNQHLLKIPNLEVKCETDIFRKSDGLLITKAQKVISLYFENENYLTCTLNHQIMTPYGWKLASELEVGDFILDENDEVIMIIHKEYEKELVDVFDLVNVEETHNYVANGVQNHNCIILDEFAFVPNNLAEEFFSSVFPTITSGQTTKLVIISTPKGMNLFYKLWLESENGMNTYVRVSAAWNEVPGRDQKFKDQIMANFAGNKEAQWRAEFEVEFLGSENTLISQVKLSMLTFINPISRSIDGFDVYERPQPGRTYCICVDVSRGVEIDYHALVVIDCTEFPYKLVAKYRNNTVSAGVYPNIIRQIGKQYNDAHVLVETNDLGQSVAEDLQNDLMYDNLIMVSFRGKKGQRADGGFSGKSQIGVKMSYQIKNLGCSVIKDFIERDKLIIQDYDIIHELSTYVNSAKGKTTWAASEGHHDDLVACLVMFGWLTSQPYFQDFTNTNIKQKLYEETLRKAEEQVSLFGFIDDGVTDFDRVGELEKDIWNLSNEKSIQEREQERRTEFNSKFDW